MTITTTVPFLQNIYFKYFPSKTDFTCSAIVLNTLEWWEIPYGWLCPQHFRSRVRTILCLHTLCFYLSALSFYLTYINRSNIVSLPLFIFQSFSPPVFVSGLTWPCLDHFLLFLKIFESFQLFRMVCIFILRLGFSLQVCPLPLHTWRGWPLWTASPAICCPLLSVWFPAIWRYWQMIKRRRDESGCSFHPHSCLPFATLSFLYQSPEEPLRYSVRWLQVLLSSRHCVFLCASRPRAGRLDALSLTPLKPAQASVNSLFIKLPSVGPLSMPSASCQDTE